MDNFTMSVCNGLLMSLQCAGIPVSKSLEFFSDNAIKMQSCEPNYGRRKSNGFMRFTLNDVWIMRGFFPKTPLMFKIVMVRTKETCAYEHDKYNKPVDYFVKVTRPKLNVPCGHSKTTYLQTEELKKLYDRQMNSLLLGDTEEVIKLSFRKPKCFSPKGCIT